MSLLLADLLLAACDGGEGRDRGDAGQAPEASDADGDGWVDAEDCAPADPAVSPSALEVCQNGVDDDCDGGADACRLQGDVPVSTLPSVDLEDGEEFMDYTMARMPDADGDGRPEILVGAPDHADGAGRLYVLASSQPLPAAISGAWATIDGSATDAARIGGAIAGVGDLDGDGRDDLVARVSPEAYTIPGYFSVLGFSAPASGRADTSSALVRWESDSGYLGHFMSGGGDVTGDGRPDIAMSYGEERTEDGDPRPLLLVFGPPTHAIESDAIVSLFEDESTSLTHGIVSTLARGDLDGDGLDDLVVSASRGGYGEGWSDGGHVMLFCGPVLGHIFVEGADRSVTTGAPGESSTPLVFEGGDMDSDGTDDLIVAEGRLNDENALHVLISSWPEAIADASAKITGGANSRSLGNCATGLGDVDGDGAADLLVADPAYGSEGIGLEGAAYLFYGPVVGSQSLDAAGFSTAGVTLEQQLGTQCAALGDWNGDARPDFALTSRPDYPYQETSHLFLAFGAGI